MTAVAQLVSGARGLLLLAVVRAAYEIWKHRNLVILVCHKVSLTVAEFGDGLVTSCVCV